MKKPAFLVTETYMFGGGMITALCGFCIFAIACIDGADPVIKLFSGLMALQGIGFVIHAIIATKTANQKH